jgi:hypothetical protein
VPITAGPLYLYAVRRLPSVAFSGRSDTCMGLLVQCALPQRFNPLVFNTFSRSIFAEAATGYAVEPAFGGGRSAPLVQVTPEQLTQLQAFQKWLMKLWYTDRPKGAVKIPTINTLRFVPLITSTSSSSSTTDTTDATATTPGAAPAFSFCIDWKFVERVTSAPATATPSTTTGKSKSTPAPAPETLDPSRSVWAAVKHLSTAEAEEYVSGALVRSPHINRFYRIEALRSDLSPRSPLESEPISRLTDSVSTIATTTTTTSVPAPSSPTSPTPVLQRAEVGGIELPPGTTFAQFYATRYSLVVTDHKQWLVQARLQDCVAKNMMRAAPASCASGKGSIASLAVAHISAEATAIATGKPVPLPPSALTLSVPSVSSGSLLSSDVSSLSSSVSSPSAVSASAFAVPAPTASAAPASASVLNSTSPPPASPTSSAPQPSSAASFAPPPAGNNEDDSDEERGATTGAAATTQHGLSRLSVFLVPEFCEWVCSGAHLASIMALPAVTWQLCEQLIIEEVLEEVRTVRLLCEGARERDQISIPLVFCCWYCCFVAVASRLNRQLT